MCGLYDAELLDSNADWVLCTLYDLKLGVIKITVGLYCPYTE